MAFRSHVDGHMDEQFFECNICTEIFSSELLLIEHLRAGHKVTTEEEKEKKREKEEVKQKKGENEAIKVPKKRGKKLRYGIPMSAAQMAQKIRNKCRLCRRQCKTETQLKAHIIAAHKGVKTHKCTKCAKCFILPSGEQFLFIYFCFGGWLFVIV